MHVNALCHKTTIGGRRFDGVPEALRWSVERISARFGSGRLWRAVADRPAAALPERQARLIEIGHESATSP